MLFRNYDILHRIFAATAYQFYDIKLSIYKSFTVRSRLSLIPGGDTLFDVLDRIRQLREARHWSVYHLAKKSGIPQSTIATWYQKNLYPPVDKLEIICQTFGISLAELFSGSLQENAFPQETEEMLRKWSLLSPKQKAILTGLMDAFLSAEE